MEISAAVVSSFDHPPRYESYDLPAPADETHDPSVEELLAGGQVMGWEFVEPRPRRLPG
ncbi:hypothetical protein [Nonomuraea guangzhouensis]|uniref:Uncharacterized protein n=1 Tax=Nonomuraea guangzhouensis TaxID=1291555 RepID=A0ABW4GUL8_9ACTN|nr:hypothetical protein [Nonomuraea guangzhouensis]